MTRTPASHDHGGATQARPRFFYRDEYVHDVREAGRRETFDVERPRRVRNALIATGLVDAAEFVAPSPLSREELLVVHTPEHVARIRDPAILARLLLLDPAHPWGDRLLDPFLFQAAGTVAAARLALRGRLLTVNLGGGFHHAQADKAEGFCAIADVAIAIRLLQRDERLGRALIVDLDCHHGNGNAEIFAGDESVFTFSMHGNNWCWIDKRHNLDVELPAHTGDDVYLRTLETHLPRIVRDFRPDLAVYIAGTDPYVEDALGDLDLSEAGMLVRDRFVVRETWERRIPTVIVTGGGYGPASWRLYFNFFRTLLVDAGAS